MVLPLLADRAVSGAFDVLVLETPIDSHSPINQIFHLFPRLKIINCWTWLAVHTALTVGKPVTWRHWEGVVDHSPRQTNVGSEALLVDDVVGFCCWSILKGESLENYGPHACGVAGPRACLRPGGGAGRGPLHVSDEVIQ